MRSSLLCCLLLLWASSQPLYAQQTHYVTLAIPEQPPCADPLGLQNDLGSLQVYPNPASGYLTITCSEEIRQVSLYNLNGKLVLHTADPRELERLNISTLPKGLYLLQAATETATLHRKLLVE